MWGCGYFLEAVRSNVDLVCAEPIRKSLLVHVYTSVSEEEAVEGIY